jgi:hypothetical protein
MLRGVGCSVVALAVADLGMSAVLAPAAPTSPHCTVPKLGPLCRSFGVFRRTGRPSDRLPWIFRDDPPLRHVDQHSSRRLRTRSPRGYAFYAAAGKRLVCIVTYIRKEAGGDFACDPPAATARGRLFLEEACNPAPRRHRVLLVELLPDGVHSATVRRVDRPRVKRAINDNLLVADLRVRSRGELPKAVEWRHAGRRHRLPLAVDDSIVTCRSTSGGS